MTDFAISFSLVLVYLSPPTLARLLPTFNPGTWTWDLAIHTIPLGLNHPLFLPCHLKGEVRIVHVTATETPLL